MSDSAESVIRGTFLCPGCPILEKRTTVGQFYLFGCPFLVNRTTKVWVCVLVVRFCRIGQFMAMASGQRTRKTMMMIMAKPVRSVKVNVSPAHATAVMVAMTGSLVPSMVARTAPTRITPAM